MKIRDFIFILCVAILFAPFFIFDEAYKLYSDFNNEHGMIMSFIKFAILATLGEIIGLRIRTGKYIKENFGVLPRAIVWGFIGLTIKMAFMIFAVGTPVFVEYMGIDGAIASMKSQDITYVKILTAFSISAAMNIIYAPVMMTFHKITDTHIESNGGSLIGLFKPIKFKEIFMNLNWAVQWGFVFKKTIPIFWIPAHTITFLLPAEHQVLFAALLSIALGIILAVANIMSKKNN